MFDTTFSCIMLMDVSSLIYSRHVTQVIHVHEVLLLCYSPLCDSQLLNVAVQKNYKYVLTWSDSTSQESVLSNHESE